VALQESTPLGETFSRKGAKKSLQKRGSALRLCAFAGEIFSA
jgi:hypothetical protein